MQHLIEEVQQIGEALSQHSEFDLRPVFRQIELGAIKKGHLLELGSQGQIVLNTQHPLAKKLGDGRPGRAHMVVSSILCIVNRSESQFTDDHQRVLHRELTLMMV